MANHLKRDRQIDVLRLLVEGNSIRSTERLTGVTKRAILRLLVRFGDSCQDLMKERFCDLSLRHVQVDEMHTFVGTRQVNLKVDQKDNPNIGEQYLWYGIDQDTKLVPTFLVGKRSADNARRLMVDLRSRLAIPTPGEADRRGGYKPIVKISTDGLAAYPEAVDLAFGPFAEYGQLIKNYQNANLPGKYSPGGLRPTRGDYTVLVVAAHLSPDESKLIAWGDRGQFSAWDMKTLKKIETINLPHADLPERRNGLLLGDNTTLAVMTNNKKLESGHTVLSIAFRDTERSKVLTEHDWRGSFPGKIPPIAHSARKGILALGGPSGAGVQIWDAGRRKRLAYFRPVSSALAISPDGKRVASVDPFNLLRVWDISDLSDGKKKSP